MDTRICAEIHAWVSDLEEPVISTAPPLDLAHHIAGCTGCRGALLLLATDLLNTPLGVEPTSCDQCQYDLAAYIDLERTEVPQAAMRAYPHVWWHLWTCVDCAESYRMVVALEDAEAAHELPPVPLSSLLSRPKQRQPQPIIQALTLPRALFARVLVPQYGTSWGVGNDDTVLHEEEHDSYELRVSVRRQGESWIVIVTVEPPVFGNAVIIAGAETFRAPIGPAGVASVGPLPTELIMSPVGPDITIKIEVAAP